VTIADAAGPGGPPLEPGQTVTYLISAANLGPGAPAAVTLRVPVPGGTSYRELDAPPGWACTLPSWGAAGEVVCVAPPGATVALPVVAASTAAAQPDSPLPAGARAGFRLAVALDPGLTPGAAVSAAARVAGEPQDAREANNQAAVVRPVAARPAVGLPRTGRPGGAGGRSPLAGYALPVLLAAGGLTIGLCGLRRRAVPVEAPSRGPAVTGVGGALQHAAGPGPATGPAARPRAVGATLRAPGRGPSPGGAGHD
jgi:uncharacterized repeat protein (TIGR01451 family)